MGVPANPVETCHRSRVTSSPSLFAMTLRREEDSPEDGKMS